MNAFDYKKSLGQNFLNDNIITEKIANVINLKENDLVIEIGPGAGALTKKILSKKVFMLLYEIDSRLECVLKNELSEYGNYELIIDDFLERNVNSDLKKYQYNNLYIIANLPYYITTPIISKIIQDKINPKEIVIMIQKEVADRFSAKPGSKDYGGLTVFLNYFYDITRVINVSKSSFTPKPKVDSTVIRMVRKDNLEKIKDFDLFLELVKDSFRFKRKTIKNNLNNYDFDTIELVLKKYGFDASTRSENIPYYVFIEITNELSKLKL